MSAMSAMSAMSSTASSGNDPPSPSEIDVEVAPRRRVSSADRRDSGANSTRGANSSATGPSSERKRRWSLFTPPKEKRSAADGAVLAPEGIDGIEDEWTVIIHSVVCGGDRGGASSPDGGSILEVMKSVTPVVKLEVEEHMAQFTNPGVSGGMRGMWTFESTFIFQEKNDKNLCLWMELCDKDYPDNAFASVSIPLTRSFNQGLFPIGDDDGYKLGEVNASIIAPYDVRSDLENIKQGANGSNDAQIGRRYQHQPCTDMFFCEGRVC